MIERFLEGLREKMKDPDDCTYMSIIIPGDLDPLARHHRFSIHLDAELRLTGLGCSVGGGTLVRDAEDEDDEPEICFCVVDVDATDVPGARALLRENLPELGAPAGTLVQWDDREDCFDGDGWLLDQPRSLDEFDL